MQLRNARLCLDCEEVHDDQHCPVCASDSYAYMSRWVPVDERRSSRRAAARPGAIEPRRGAGKKWVAGGALGVGVWALTKWLARGDRKPTGGSQERGSSES